VRHVGPAADADADADADGRADADRAADADGGGHAVPAAASERADPADGVAGSGVPRAVGSGHATQQRVDPRLRLTLPLTRHPTTHVMR